MIRTFIATLKRQCFNFDEDSYLTVVDTVVVRGRDKEEALRPAFKYFTKDFGEVGMLHTDPTYIGFVARGCTFYINLKDIEFINNGLSLA